MHFLGLFEKLWAIIGPFLGIRMVYLLLFLQYYDGRGDLRHIERVHRRYY